MSIKVVDLSHIYDKGDISEITAIYDLNYDFPDRFFTAVVGETGSGKSTFVQHINGLLKPTAGKIIVNDFTLSANKKENSKNILNLRRQIGYLFQFSENQLFENDVLKDVMFGPLNYGYSEEEAKKAAIEALDIVGIPHVYFDKAPFELSGGEKRRIALAGVLAYKPNLLILDEPTAGLDNEVTKNLLALLNKLYENGTNILLVTHDMDVVLNCAKNVLLFSEGKIICDDDINTFFAKDYSQYNIEQTELIKVIKKLKEFGFAVNFDKIHDFSDLEKVIRSIKKWMIMY